MILQGGLTIQGGFNYTSPEPPFEPTTFTTFSPTGSDQTFTVPGGVTRIRIWCWGAGGGAGNSNSSGLSGANGAGGGGLYVPSFGVTPGESLTVVVATRSSAYQNKTNGNVSNGNPPNFDTAYPSFVKGGAGGTVNNNGGWGGYGGGPSGIKRSGSWVARAYGGGGGGGAGHGNNTVYSPNAGEGTGAGGAGAGGSAGSGNSGTDGTGGGGGGGADTTSATGGGAAGSNGTFIVPSGGITYNNADAIAGNSEDVRYPTSGGNANPGLGGLGTTANIFGRNGLVIIGY